MQLSILRGVAFGGKIGTTERIGGEMPGKECFVIMPIRKDGTDEYRHHKTLYQEWIKPIPEGYGYSVVRADEIQRTGLITQDVILGLARADLVIADLTDLNANVFYELGVRHALRGQGTIMLLDESRTQEVPFDIGAYRVIKFSSDMYGLSTLRTKLSAYIDSLSSEMAVEDRDNPVHDTIPSLPMNILSSSTGSEEGKLREQLTVMHRVIQKYQQQFGEITRERETESLSVRIHALVQQINDGSFGPDLVKKARAAVAQQDRTGYTDVLQRIIQDETLRLSSREYLSLSRDAQNLGLNQAMSIVFDLAKRVHPNDEELRAAELGYFAHSFDPAERRRARDEISRELGIQINDDNITFTGNLADRRLSLIGLMLDAYHNDNMHEEALRITRALISELPENTIVLRNHARALEYVGRGDEALEWYQRSIWCPEPEDQSALWLGSELHNRRRNVDALEAYMIACMLDPADARFFAHAADEISLCIDRREYRSSNAVEERELPEEIDLPVLERVILATFSCDVVSQADLDRCVEAARRAGVESDRVAQMYALRGGNVVKLDGEVIRQLRQSERRQLADWLHEILESPVTRRPETPRSEDQD